MTRTLVLLGLILCSGLLAAQLRRGDIILESPQRRAIDARSYPLGFDDPLLSVTTSGNSFSEREFAASLRVGAMITDRFQLGTSLFVAPYADEVEAAAGLRAYLWNTHRGSVYMGADALYFDERRGNRKDFGAYPSLGLSAWLNESAQLSGDVGYLLRGAGRTDQLLLSLRVGFRLDGERTDSDKPLPAYGRGHLMLGTGGLSFSKPTDGGGARLSLRPEAHYFFTPTTAIGLRGRFQRVPFDDQRRQFEIDWGIGPTIRQFITPARTAFAPFVQLGLGRNGFTWFYPTQFGYEKQVERYYSLDAAAGGLWFLQPSVALEIALGYSRTREGSTSRIGDTDNLALTIGARVMIATRRTAYPSDGLEPSDG